MDVTVGEGTGVFSKKRGGSREKKGRFERKSTSFCLFSSYSQKMKHFSREIFDGSKLNPYFALDKTQLPFIPPHCGVYIAQSRGIFLDHPAQTLFD